MFDRKIATFGLLFSMALGLTSAGIFTGPDEFDATWLNIDSTTTWVTRVDIEASLLIANVRVWGKCTPTDCDWGLAQAIKPRNPIVVNYDHGFVTRRVTLRLISRNSLEVTIFSDYDEGDPRADFSKTGYFYRQGVRDVKPDLVVSSVSIPSNVIVYGAEPWTWINFTVRNEGPGILEDTAVKGVIVEATRNGEDHLNSGWFDITYASPFVPGATYNHGFALGFNELWPVGSYSIRIGVDSEDAVDEYVESNNISYPLRFDVLDENYLAGTVLYNGQPLSNFTSESNVEVFYRDEVTGEMFYDVDSWYDSSSGHYYLSGLPETEIYLWFRVHPEGERHSLPGNYFLAKRIDLRGMPASEASDYDLDMTGIVHMVHPSDNSIVFASDENMADHCGVVDFEWDSVEGASYYRLKILHYRGSDHPDGFGLLGTVADETTSETYHWFSVPVSGEHEYYQLSLEAFNSEDVLLSYYFKTRQNGYNWRYTFRVLGLRHSVGDINIDCRVDMVDFAILAKHWLENTAD